MPNNPHHDFDQTVLDMIEHSPSGAVPRTPTYDEAISRLRSHGQIYSNADHKDCWVTARSLAKLPVFQAENLPSLIAGAIDCDELEGNNAIFDRYVKSLPAPLRAKAETYRGSVAGRPIHHRAKSGGTQVQDPLNTLFLVPGAGPQPALPGNYLHGAVTEYHDAGHPLPWCVHINDSSNDAALFDAATLPEALAKLEELIASAPFHLSELEALGFRLN